MIVILLFYSFLQLSQTVFFTCFWSNTFLPNSLLFIFVRFILIIHIILIIIWFFLSIIFTIVWRKSRMKNFRLSFVTKDYLAFGSTPFSATNNLSIYLPTIWWILIEWTECHSEQNVCEERPPSSSPNISHLHPHSTPLLPPKQIASSHIGIILPTVIII